MTSKNSFRIGYLYPRMADGQPNLILSSGYLLEQDSDGYCVRERKKNKKGKLKAELSISTDPVHIEGASNFANSWLKPQLLAKTDPTSIFQQYWTSIVEVAWPTGAYSNNLLLEALSYLGYRGYGWDKTNNNSDLWKEKSEASGLLYESVKDLNNYFPELLWGGSKSGDSVKSDYDTEYLLMNLAKMQGDMTGEPPLWLPSMLFSYGIKGKGTSYPGPVLMIRPGERLDLEFQNKISIPGLSEQQNQDATLVPNSSYGLNGGSTAGGMFSTNFHMHGGHVSATGFGDNVVGRYTTGQNWTTSIEIPEDHGQGSYWYHPHYHPAVNTQLYGGLSGFMQVGDPLAKVPYFRNTPRNLAVLKTMQVGVDPVTGELQLAAINGNILGTNSLAPNRASMVTVNGEYKPNINFSKGGWQALTLSNQDNNYYMNISIRHKEQDGSWSEVPLFIYGEDGHQYPQIRAATHGALGYAQLAGENATAYAQAQNLISLSSGKRVDILFYLPSGESEIVSSYGFKDSADQRYEINNLRFQANQYVDLASTNVNPTEPRSGPGAIAKFIVQGDSRSPSSDELNDIIKQANKGIKVQTIIPQTSVEDYDNEAVPSVNLFAKDKDGEDKWVPIRKREFNYEVLALVGPKEERDIPTQKALADYKLKTGKEYQRYSVVPTDEEGAWLGYENADFINDHVFPNGPLIISMIGTMESWNLKNWNWGGPSVANGGYMVGHPFHIHVNDYQVEESDTELPDKRNLEDVTMLNASGYHYADASGTIQKLDPYAGTFTPIPEAFEYTSDFYKNGLFTTGYNDTNIRMLFQDFLGTYVHHCHLLEHEDAGMMQVVTVIENTNSSWLLAAEGLKMNKKGLILREADSLKEVTLGLSSYQAKWLKRAQVGDLSGDFVQDIILASGSPEKGGAGCVQIFDGERLLNKGSSKLIASFRPYKKSTLAPWAFNSDFTGDGTRELVTGGFISNNQSNVRLTDFEITGWQPNRKRDKWTAAYRQRPWQDVEGIPSGSISSTLTSFAVGDFNLDNFDDYAVAYFSGSQLRVRILDGAARALKIETGVDQGGYLPESTILSDMTYSGSFHADVDSIVLTTGFNSYSQSPIENLIVTASAKAGHSWALTFQLDAGHFIATGEDSHSEHMANGSSDHHGGGGFTDNPEVHNDGPLPLHLTASRHWHGDLATATPTFTGVLGHGALLVGDNLVISQGISQDGFTSGNTSSSNLINNTTQELCINIKGIDRVTRDDLTGIIDTNLGSTLTASQTDERVHLATLAYQVYTSQMVKPSDLSTLAAGTAGGSLSVGQLVNTILSSYASEISAYYGGSLEQVPTTQIIEKAYQTLYNRLPTVSERMRWSSAVDDGLATTNLPMAILQDTSDSDSSRVAFLSAASQWSLIQWGTSAVIDGSFGQGLQAESSSFAAATQAMLVAPATPSWKEAQNLFNGYRDGVMDLLDGTPVSNTGFF